MFFFLLCNSCYGNVVILVGVAGRERGGGKLFLLYSKFHEIRTSRAILEVWEALLPYIVNWL